MMLGWSFSSKLDGGSLVVSVTKTAFKDGSVDLLYDFSFSEVALNL